MQVSPGWGNDARGGGSDVGDEPDRALDCTVRPDERRILLVRAVAGWRARRDGRRRLPGVPAGARAPAYLLVARRDLIKVKLRKRQLKPHGRTKGKGAIKVVARPGPEPLTGRSRTEFNSPKAPQTGADGRGNVKFRGLGRRVAPMGSGWSFASHCP
jgi:hypothetical protein